MQKNQYYRRQVLCRLRGNLILAVVAAGLFSGTASLSAQTEIDVTDTTSLQNAINTANANPGTTYAINLQNPITLTGALPVITTTSNLSINGSTLSGPGMLTQYTWATTTVTNAINLTESNNFAGATTVSYGTVAVQGAGASLGGSVIVGDYNGDNGTLLISNGGQVKGGNYGGEIAYLPGSTGSATVTGVNANGAASTWSSSGLTVGGDGTGTLTIEDGGQVINTQGAYISLGAAANGIYGDMASGTATVKGVNANGTASTWSSRDLYVGGVYSGGPAGTLNIQDGGQVIAGESQLDRGTVTVTGVNADGTASTWSNLGQLYVGELNTSTVTVQNGGVVSCATMLLGNDGMGDSYGL